MRPPDAGPAAPTRSREYGASAWPAAAAAAARSAGQSIATGASLRAPGVMNQRPGRLPGRARPRARFSRYLPAIQGSHGLDSATALSGHGSRASAQACTGLAFGHPGGSGTDFPCPCRPGPAIESAVLPAPAGRLGHRRYILRVNIRIAAVFGAVALLAAACGSSSSSGSGAPAASPKSSSGAAAGGGKFLACMGTDTAGITDKSFNQSSYSGGLAAASTDTNLN